MDIENQLLQTFLTKKMTVGGTAHQSVEIINQQAFQQEAAV